MNFPKLKSDVFLAPMAGVTDLAFRILCKKYGAGLAPSEMISANALARKNRITLSLINLRSEEKPRCLQLFGQDKENLVKASKLCQAKCEILDLNFGCPASKIIRQGAGSALMESPEKIQEIVKAVVGAVDIPVTCKLRLGLSDSKINVLKVAKACEKAGARLITVHARTQKQGYAGKADWSWIKKVKATVKIPVCGNGDVWSVEDYIKMKKETGCDYVMIGRATIGNPYLFQQIKDQNKKGSYEKNPPQKKLFFEYLKLAKKHQLCFEQIRFQAQAFTKGVKDAAKLRNQLAKAKDLKEVERTMELI